MTEKTVVELQEIVGRAFSSMTFAKFFRALGDVPDPESEYCTSEWLKFQNFACNLLTFNSMALAKLLTPEDETKFCRRENDQRSP